MKRIFSGLCVLITVMMFSHGAVAQELPAKAFKNVTLHKANGEVVEDAVIVWRNGVIETAGKSGAIPFDAQVWDGGDSLHVYPGFIDGYSLWGSPQRKDFDSTPQYRGDPSYKRAGIRPNRKARESVNMNSEDFKKGMQAGFTTAALGTKGYMMPGQLDIFLLQPNLEITDLYAGEAGLQMQFQRSNRVYPTTVMGIMAKFEQMILNARALRQWQQYYDAKPTKIAPPPNNPVLEALYPVMDKKKRIFFRADSQEMIQRIFELQDKLGFEWVLVSGMEAYEVAAELKKRKVPVLASINFPKKPEWKKEDYEEKEELTDKQQAFRDKRWQAYLKRYKNISALEEAGVKVGFATSGLDIKEFPERLKEWNEYGNVNEKEMLRVLTRNTAEILGHGRTLGGLDEGQIASFSIMNQPFTETEVKTLYSVSAGEMNELND